MHSYLLNWQQKYLNSLNELINILKDSDFPYVCITKISSY